MQNERVDGPHGGVSLFGSCSQLLVVVQHPAETQRHHAVHKLEVTTAQKSRVSRDQVQKFGAESNPRQAP